MSANDPISARIANLRRDDHLETVPLQDGLGAVAWFRSDKGLRSHGQFSLVQRTGPGYGLVITADGRVPRDEEAGELLRKSNQAPR